MEQTVASANARMVQSSQKDANLGLQINSRFLERRSHLHRALADFRLHEQPEHVHLARHLPRMYVDAYRNVQQGQKTQTPRRLKVSIQTCRTCVWNAPLFCSNVTNSLMLSRTSGLSCRSLSSFCCCANMAWRLGSSSACLRGVVENERDRRTSRV